MPITPFYTLKAQKNYINRMRETDYEAYRQLKRKYEKTYLDKKNKYVISTQTKKNFKNVLKQLKLKQDIMHYNQVVKEHHYEKFKYVLAELKK